MHSRINSFNTITNLFLGLVLISCNVSAQAIKEAIGHWEGMAGSGKQSMKIMINFSDNKCSYDAPDLGIFGQLLTDYSFHGKSFSITIPEKNPIILKGKLENRQMTGEIAGKNPMPFQLEKKSVTPEFFHEEEVTYRSGGITLSGTLIKPGTTGKYPVAVMIHGSSAQGKMTRATTRSRAILFVKSGIAALIYDRRGNGKSTGDNDRILKMELLAKDAAAGVEFLSTRNDINKNKIGLYGISQGGWVAPYAAGFTNKINFIITVSAPGITPDEQNDFASGKVVSAIIDDNLKKAGVPEPAVYSNNQLLKDTSTKEIIPGFSNFNPLPYWEKIKVPVLAIWGSSDDVVPAEKSKKLIEESLMKAGNKNYLMKIFPKGDHLLRLSIPNADSQNPFKPIVPGTQEFMVSWIQNNVLK